MPHVTPERGYWCRIGLKADAAGSDLWRCHSDYVNAELLRRWVPPTGIGRVLKTDLYDEALGEGLYPFLATIGAKVVGIDVSQSVRRRAVQRHPQLLALDSDVRALPFQDGAFDAIVSNSTLDHFSSEAEILAAISELSRVLAPGGHLVLTLDNPSNPVVWIRNRIPRRWQRALHIVPYYVGATLCRERLAVSLRGAGLHVLEESAILHCPRAMAIAAARLLNWCGPRLRVGFVRVLACFEHLASCGTRYRTGYFIAAHAIKPGGYAVTDR